MRISTIATSVVIAGSLALSSCSLIGDQQSNTPSTEAQPTDSSEPPSADPMSELPDSVTILEPVDWSFPEHIDGWEPSDTGQPGMKQFIRGTDCQFTSQAIVHNEYQALGDRAKSQEQMDHWKQPIITADPNASFDTKESSEVTTDTGEPVTMLRTDTRYVGEDGITYKTAVWIRSFTEVGQQGTVSLAYSCSEATYSDEELQGLLGQTHLRSIPSEHTDLK